MAVAVISTTATIGGPASPGSAAAAKNHNAFRQVNLVSDLLGDDLPGGKAALLFDEEVKNPWGIALGPNTPLWVSNNFNPDLLDVCNTCIPKPEQLETKVTLYRGANGVEEFTKVESLEVTASSPTGIVFNPTSSFVVKQGNVRAPARFLLNELFVDKAGPPVAKITGWTNKFKMPTVTAKTRAKKNGAFHTGLALVPAGSGGSGPGNSQPILLAADVESNTIDVFDRAFKPLKMPKAFVDPGAKGPTSAIHAYNVAFLKNRVYVTYADQDGRKSALSVFTRDGRFIKRLVTNGRLSGPWGMTVAPSSWGKFGGAILVGNVVDGKINAFNRRNGKLLGTIKDANNKPLVNPGLWGLEFGNGTIGTPNTLLFAAGIGSGPGGTGEDGYAHGLVGLIKPVGR